MTRRTQTTAGALAAAVFLLGACSTAQKEHNDVSSAGCYGPWLDDDAVGEPPDGPPSDTVVTISPGETVKVYGHGYTSTCNDTGGDSDLRPLGPVSLTVSLPGGGGLQLGEFTPRVEKTDVGFVVSVSVPGGTPSGAAVVSDDRSPATTYRFTVKR
jgi:hypothetical protein